LYRYVDGWAYDTQILEWVLSYDGVRSTDALAITAASAATAISDVPFKKPVAGVRVGLLPGSSEPIINPTSKQMETSRLDLVLAGTEDAVMMIEGFGDFLSVDEMLYAIEKGHEAVAQACREIEAWAAEVGRPKATAKMLVTPAEIDAAVAAAVGPECAEGMAISVKQQRGAAVERIRNKAVDMLLGTAAGGDGGEKGYQVRGKPDAGFIFFIFCFPLDSLHANKTKTHTTRSHSSEGPPSRLTREAEGVWPNCRGRKAKPTRSLNARSAHPGVAPGYFRCCCFASS
jgi:hypothetical protein